MDAKKNSGEGRISAEALRGMAVFLFVDPTEIIVVRKSDCLRDLPDRTVGGFQQFFRLVQSAVTDIFRHAHLNLLAEDLV